MNCSFPPEIYVKLDHLWLVPSRNACKTRSHMACSFPPKMHVKLDHIYLVRSLPEMHVKLDHV